MSKHVKKMLGRQYGYLTIIKFSHKIRKSNVYFCQCICGKIVNRISSSLSIGLQQKSIISCGCNGRSMHGKYKCTKCDEWKQMNEFYKDSSTPKGHASSCKKCHLKLDKLRYQRPEIRLRIKNTQKIWSKKQYLSNPLYKVRRNLSRRLNLALKVKSYKKDTQFMQILSCSLEELRNHIESQFKPGMTWENHSLYGWHIDHIIPLSSAKTQEELYKLCHYSNLQPLWAYDNLSKGNKP